LPIPRAPRACRCSVRSHPMLILPVFFTIWADAVIAVETAEVASQEVTDIKMCTLVQAVRFAGDFGQVWIGNDADAYFPVLTGRPPVFTTGNDTNFTQTCRDRCESEPSCFNWCFAAQRPEIGGTCFFFEKDAVRLTDSPSFTGGSCNHTTHEEAQQQAEKHSLLFDMVLCTGLALLLFVFGAVLHFRARRRTVKAKEVRDLETGSGQDPRSTTWMEELSETVAEDDLRNLVSEPAQWGLTVDQLVAFYDEHRGFLEAYCRDHYLGRKSMHVCKFSPCPHNHGCARFREQATAAPAGTTCQELQGESGSMRSTTASQDEAVEEDEEEDEEEEECDEVLQPLALTMHVVVDVVIKPLTSESEGILGYAPLLNRRQPLRASIFVSHCWSELFSDFVRTLTTHLPSTSVVWVCSFALPQNCNIYKMVSQGELGHCPFAKALVQADRVVVVVDERVLPLERIWCLYEMYICVKRQIRMDVRAPKMSKSLFRTILSKADKMDIRDCSSTREQDKQRILNEVSGAEEAVNCTVRQNIEELVRLMESVQD